MEESKPSENKYSSYRAVNEIEEQKQDVITLKLNAEERKQLEIDKATIQQEKDSTAIKQLWGLGSKVLHETPEGHFFKVTLDNMRKNKRLGIVEVEPKL